MHQGVPYRPENENPTFLGIPTFFYPHSPQALSNKIEAGGVLRIKVKLLSCGSHGGLARVSFQVADGCRAKVTNLQKGQHFPSWHQKCVPDNRRRTPPGGSAKDWTGGGARWQVPGGRARQMAVSQTV